MTAIADLQRYLGVILNLIYVELDANNFVASFVINFFGLDLEIGVFVLDLVISNRDLNGDDLIAICSEITDVKAKTDLVPIKTTDLVGVPN